MHHATAWLVVCFTLLLGARGLHEYGHSMGGRGYSGGGGRFHFLSLRNGVLEFGGYPWAGEPTLVGGTRWQESPWPAWSRTRLMVPFEVRTYVTIEFQMLNGNLVAHQPAAIELLQPLFIEEYGQALSMQPTLIKRQFVMRAFVGQIVVMLSPVVGILGVLLLIRTGRRAWRTLVLQRRLARGQCLRCGYPLGGNAICPECGVEEEPRQPGAVYQVARRHHPAPKSACLGLFAGFFGVAAGCWVAEYLRVPMMLPASLALASAAVSLVFAGLLVRTVRRDPVSVQITDDALLIRTMTRQLLVARASIAGAGFVAGSGTATGLKRVELRQRRAGSNRTRTILLPASGLGEDCMAQLRRWLTGVTVDVRATPSRAGRVAERAAGRARGVLLSRQMILPGITLLAVGVWLGSCLVAVGAHSSSGMVLVGQGAVYLTWHELPATVRAPADVNWTWFSFWRPIAPLWWFHSGTNVTARATISLVVLPLWPLVLPPLALTIRQWWIAFAGARRQPDARPCSACGYEMAGLDPRAACPECGRPPWEQAAS